MSVRTPFFVLVALFFGLLVFGVFQSLNARAEHIAAWNGQTVIEIGTPAASF